MKLTVNQTKKGNRCVLYDNMMKRTRSKMCKNNKVHFTRDEFYSWLSKDKYYKSIYKTWSDSGYDSRLSPSIDRIDNSKEYTFSNIQVLTRHDNLLKGKKDIKTREDLTYLQKKRHELIYTLDYEDYSNIQIGIIMNIERTWVFRTLQKKPKGWKPDFGYY